MEDKRYYDIDDAQEMSEFNDASQFAHSDPTGAIIKVIGIGGGELYAVLTAAVAPDERAFFKGQPVGSGHLRFFLV